MEEFGYTTEEQVKNCKPVADDEPIIKLEQDSNLTKIDIKQLKKTSGEK